MNILALLDSELKNKNWTLAEKIRYLYIRSCQLFSYDDRYDFYRFLPDGDNRKKELRERTFNLEQIESDSIVCTPHAWDVFASLVEELIQIQCNRSGNTNHGWCIVHDGVRQIDADAAISSDFARVKMNLTTGHYKPVIEERNKNAFFYRGLAEIDQNIGYIKNEYFNAYLARERKSLDNKMSSSSLSREEKLLYKVATIHQLFQTNYHFQHYSDASYCIHYLQIKLLENEELEKICELPLFQNYNDKLWEFMSIYFVDFRDERRYFMLNKDSNKDSYTFSEIKKEDAFCYTCSMHGDEESKRFVLR